MTEILLVDDHPAICFALKVLLEKNNNFRVTPSSGDNLITQLHRDRPELLILDLELQKSDGLDLLPRIRQHFPTLKVLIFTNQPASIYALRTLHAGADGFVNKNLSLDSVESVCLLIMGGYQCFPNNIFSRAAALPQHEEPEHSLLTRFSDREIAVLNYLKQGKTNKEIADLLSLSNKTISTYKVRMLKKCGYDDLGQLLALIGQGNEK